MKSPHRCACKDPQAQYFQEPMGERPPGVPPIYVVQICVTCNGYVPWRGKFIPHAEVIAAGLEPSKLPAWAPVEEPDTGLFGEL